MASSCRLPAALPAAYARLPRGHVLLMTGYGTVETAVSVMKKGAADFLARPVDPDLLLMMVARHVEARRASVARALHALSPRAKGPFVAANLAALPEGPVENELLGHERGAYTGASERLAGRFDLADGGTLFLDEIGEFPFAAQAKVLRVVEKKSFLRVGGTVELRCDLRLPPLRARRGDVALLATSFAREAARQRRRPEPAPPPTSASRCAAWQSAWGDAWTAGDRDGLLAGHAVVTFQGRPRAIRCLALSSVLFIRLSARLPTAVEFLEYRPSSMSKRRSRASITRLGLSRRWSLADSGLVTGGISPARGLSSPRVLRSSRNSGAATTPLAARRSLS